MAIKEVECILRDARFAENIPEEGTTYDPYVEIIYEITKSDEPHDVGLAFKSTLFEEEIRDLVGLSRVLSSKEMVYFVKQLNQRTEPFRMVVDTDNELVSAELLMLDRVPKPKPKPKSKKNAAEKPLHERIEENANLRPNRWNYRKNGDMPIGNNDYADTIDPNI